MALRIEVNIPEGSPLHAVLAQVPPRQRAALLREALAAYVASAAVRPGPAQPMAEIPSTVAAAASAPDRREAGRGPSSLARWTAEGAASIAAPPEPAPAAAPKQPPDVGGVIATSLASLGLNVDDL